MKKVGHVLKDGKEKEMRHFSTSNEVLNLLFYESVKKSLRYSQRE